MSDVIKNFSLAHMNSYGKVRGLKSRVVLSLLVFMCGWIWSSHAFAANNSEEFQTPVEMVVNGEFILTDVSPVFDQNYLLVPLRFISEAFDYKVEYETIRKMVFYQFARV
ncbi:stalk domain-containing protein [Paenibacillus ihumii]|uniref:stalk domain-containing protein n=1 Tax=Paenibacillus ihumii TaxID=687436 RepID=UPI0006D79D80|nr:stalk domain-containing protein [Paenibacillus ihumii]